MGSSESSGDVPLFPILYDAATDSDAGSFIEHNENNDDDNKEFYKPETYLNSVESYNIYIVSNSDDTNNNEPPIPSDSNNSNNKDTEIINDKQQKPIESIDTSLIIQPTQSQ